MKEMKNNMDYTFKFKNYAEALYSALCVDPFYMTMEKTIDVDKSPKDSMLKYMDYSMNEALNFGELYIPNNHEYGVSVWAKPINLEQEVLKKQDKKSFLLAELGATSLQTYEAITNFMSIEAESMGLSTCWIAWFELKYIRHVLDIPSDKYVVAIIPLGYSENNPKPRPRRKLDETIDCTYSLSC